MKKSLIFIAMLLVSFTMAAQDNGNREEMKEKFFQAKVKEMVYRLDITDEQKPEFVKVYRAYTDAMREAFGNASSASTMPRTKCATSTCPMSVMTSAPTSVRPFMTSLPMSSASTKA